MTEVFSASDRAVFVSCLAKECCCPVTGGHYVGLMSLLGVLKRHTELVRQTAHYQHAYWSHQKISRAGILLRRPSVGFSADSKQREVSMQLSLLEI